MDSYSLKVIDCLSQWADKMKECKGEATCLEDCSKHLRDCLDSVFPSSTTLQLESDKVNYIFSTIFFLSNRLTKAITGLSEIDRSIELLVKEGQSSKTNTNNKNDFNYKVIEKKLDEILSKYF